jgi:hypothetical protein
MTYDVVFILDGEECSTRDGFESETKAEDWMEKVQEATHGRARNAEVVER